jgi:hypothetical protein
MKLLRFASAQEVQSLSDNGFVEPQSSQRAWSGKKRLYAFPLDTYTIQDFKLIKEYLEVAYDIEYAYMLFLEVQDSFITFAAYDKEIVDMTLGKQLNFDVDDTSYTMAVYVVPEVRLSRYTLENVVKLESL